VRLPRPRVRAASNAAVAEAAQGEEPVAAAPRVGARAEAWRASWARSARAEADSARAAVAVDAEAVVVAAAVEAAVAAEVHRAVEVAAAEAAVVAAVAVVVAARNRAHFASPTHSCQLFIVLTHTINNIPTLHRWRTIIGQHSAYAEFLRELMCDSVHVQLLLSQIYFESVETSFLFTVAARQNGADKNVTAITAAGVICTKKELLSIARL
jgi:N-acetylglucosamine-6-phosphate deacetylase